MAKRLWTVEQYMVKCPCNNKDDKLLMIKDENKFYRLIYKGWVVLDNNFINVQNKTKFIITVFHTQSLGPLMGPQRCGSCEPTIFGSSVAFGTKFLPSFFLGNAQIRLF